MSNHPRRTLDEALNSAGLAAAAQKSFLVAANIEDVCCRLAGYLTLAFPSDAGEPLLVACLRNGFVDGRVGADCASQNKFLVSLVSAAGQLTKRRLAVQAGKSLVAWVPFAESIGEFLQRHDGATPHVVEEAAPGDIDEDMASMMLAVRIMPAHDADVVCHALMRRRFERKSPCEADSSCAA